MKRLLSVILALVLLMSAAVAETVSVSALNGPTGMGLVKLMADEEGNDAYSFTLAASADMITPGIIKGETDIAFVPANLASVLYNKTNGGVRVLGISTLGVLYIVDRGGEIASLADLKGRTLYASGKGATPEYALNYLLKANGIDPETDVNIVYKSEHAECLTALINDETACAMLPQPFVTVAQSKQEDIRIAIDLTEEWNALDNGSTLITGAFIARTEFISENPAAVNAFIEGYAASVEYVNANAEEAASLVGKYEIVAEQVALKALPYCNIVCITGENMKSTLSGYLSVLFEQDPSSVGGSLPDEAFYYEY